MKIIYQFSRVAIASIATAFIVGCASTSDHGHGFSYDAQDKWEFQSGSSQSPIDIQHYHSVPMQGDGSIYLNYSPTIIDEEDNSHTIQVNTTGQAQINGRTFQLAQFHFHSPSEHTLSGQYYPLEVHFVHKAQDGRLAVIGVFFAEGAENPAFEKVLQNIRPGEKNTNVQPFDFTGLLPQERSYYHYLGSLTTPPLLENVEWYVMKTPISVSRDQITRFQQFYNGNNRKVQPVNDRPVLFNQAH